MRMFTFNLVLRSTSEFDDHTRMEKELMSRGAHVIAH